MSYQTSKQMKNVPSNDLDHEIKGTALTAIFALLSYASALVALLWFVAFLIPKAFLADFLSLVPTLDSAPHAPIEQAILIDFLLVSLFGICHSVFARPAVKKWMNLPKQCERSFFLIQANICLGLLMLFWRNFDGPLIWDVTSSEQASAFLTGFNLFGFLFLVTSTFALDHFHLFGLSQGTGIDLNKAVGLNPNMTTTEPDASQSTHLIAKETTDSKAVRSVRWHYGIVAHPIMTGVLIMMWSTAQMTMSHFLLSAMFTMYIVIAVLHFEEPDLIKIHGAEYQKYLTSVPRFIPFTKNRQ